MKSFNDKTIEYIYDYLKEGYRPFLYEFQQQFVEIKNADDLLQKMRAALNDCNYKLLKKLNHILSIYDLVEKKTTFRHYPRTLQLEHTSYCNAECIMCVHYYNQNKNAKHLSNELYEKIKTIFPYLEEVVLHGNGEPFMLPNLDTVLKTYEEYDIKVSTNTNMSILPEAVLRHINIFKTITVSFDSPQKEVFETIRRNLDFDAVTNNIDALKKVAPTLDMTLAVVSMRQNILDSKNLVKYAFEHGFKRITFSRLGVNGYINNWFDDVVHYPTITKKCMIEAIEYAREKNIEIVYPDIFLMLPEGDEQEERIKMDSYPLSYSNAELNKLRERVLNTPKRGELYFDEVDLKPSRYKCKGICDILLNNVMITAKGEIIACCIDVLHHIDILDKPLNQIWNNEKYIELREMFFKKNILPEYCRNCMFILNNLLEKLSVETDDAFYINKK